ncbi:hypothetical protein CNMCM5793_009397 [Aspergillus hiratsukae]|uniref:Uncharacterized protein n=1 Tax=Aspergillus hiratsukae TaxID=1194566 RepID=A0A8H6UCX9_9EURO|nr:hypothetical protein CNMCM5793_009397 [Aspergillus hiratsukae]
MYLHLPPVLTLTLTLILSTSSALQTREILVPRNPLAGLGKWDLRLLGPGCNPNASNIDISVFHRSGRYGRECEDLDASVYNDTNVKSVSWKSPGPELYDLCLLAVYGVGGV